MLLLRFTLVLFSALDGGGNDDTHTDNDGGGNDGGGNVSMFEDFSLQMPWRTLVKYLETEYGRGDANGGKDEHIADGRQQALGMPIDRGNRCLVGCQRRRCDG